MIKEQFLKDAQRSIVHPTKSCMRCKMHHNYQVSRKPAQFLLCPMSHAHSSLDALRCKVLLSTGGDHSSSAKILTNT
eukprot:scaffold2951_cov92-Skeletonema_dohrnii-CCMP3373.AAC.2